MKLGLGHSKRGAELAPLASPDASMMAIKKKMKGNEKPEAAET